MPQISKSLNRMAPFAGPITQSASARLTHAGASALAPGTFLGEFEVIRLLGSGGFGIVYLAHDRLLLRQVAIKEYMPATLAGRRQGQSVVVHHESAAKSFGAGLASFLNEAQLLARFDHPALVKVYRFWRANNTAYMAMPYYAGRTLKEERAAMRNAPQEAWLRALAEPLLSALELLHGQGTYHRDISPDNIMIRPDGRPVLLDFGSARHAIGDGNGALTVLLKPNFAPIEQYGDGTGLRQGPWTDVYALGATLRFALTGQAPTPSVVRVVCDDISPLANALPFLRGGVSPAFMAAIDWALAIKPEERPQDMASLRQAMRRPVAKLARQGRSDHARALAPRRPRVTALVALALALASGVGWIASRDRSVTSTADAATVTKADTAAHPSTLVTSDLAPVTTTERSSESALERIDQTSLVRAANALRTPPPAAPRARKFHGEPVAATERNLGAAPTSSAGGTPTREVAGSLETCEALGFFARQRCIASQCERPALQANSQCVERRRMNDERLRRMQQ